MPPLPCLAAAACPCLPLPAPACSLAVRSVCIRNVHPAASDRVIIAHFGTCGYIEDIDYLRWVLGGWVGGCAGVCVGGRVVPKASSLGR